MEVHFITNDMCTKSCSVCAPDFFTNLYFFLTGEIEVSLIGGSCSGEYLMMLPQELEALVGGEGEDDVQMEMEEELAGLWLDKVILITVIAWHDCDC